MRKILLWFLIIFFACNTDKKGSDTEEADGIFLDYKISGEEGYNKLTILARFRSGGRNEETVLLKTPAKVELDGEAFVADSTVMSGGYYELYKSITDFAGKHTISYTDFNKKVHNEEFSFEPMILRSEIPEVMRRGEVYFDLSGVEEGDKIRILMTDTSFINDGINKLDSVKNGRVAVTPEDLKNLADGPIQLELVKEKERPIIIGDERRGRLRIFYVLRRSFLLEN